MIHGEFIRNAFYLSQDHGGSRYETIYLHDPKEGKHKRIFCSCDRRKAHATCVHADHTVEFFERLREGVPQQTSPDHIFRDSLWYQVFKPIMAGATPQVSSLSLMRTETAFEIIGREGGRLATVSGEPQSNERLLRRLDSVTDPAGEPARGFLGKIREFVLTDTERKLAEEGVCSTRLREEDTLWFRLAYHCFMESYTTGVDFHAAIDNVSGDLKLSCSSRSPDWRIEVAVPRSATAAVLRILQRLAPETAGFSFVEGERELLFRVLPHENSQWRLEAGIMTETADEPGFQPVHDRFIHGQMAYWPSLGKVYCLTSSSCGCLGLRLHELAPMDGETLSRCMEKNIARFSVARENEIAQTDLFGDSGATNLARIISPPLLSEYSAIELEPVALDEQACRARVWYVNGGVRTDVLSLREARDRNCRFLFQDDAVVDTASDAIASMMLSGTGVSEQGTMTMPRSHLMRLAGSGMRIGLARENRFRTEIAHIMDIEPMTPLKKLKSLKSRLRAYQKRAVEWLLFLYDNHFGGLLCDEMGLGKTHEALGAVVAVREQRAACAPALVVCPTSVISHWQRLIANHAPAIRVSLYHGSDRSLPDAADIILTSFHIMRNDCDILSQIKFDILIFDEIQNLKNRSTGFFEAASHLKGRCRFGLTGTPVENSIADLKSLFDIVLPGYLGEDDPFIERFLLPIEKNNDRRAQQRLRRLTGPFIMRRMKKEVLTELPEKIENMHSCSLSQEQRTLYNRVRLGEGREILDACRNPGMRVPYLHAFHVLNKLKQICDHPAVFLKTPERYVDFKAGKFDLFTELLAEALDSGEKVAVFTQYLRMTEIIGNQLASMNTGHVILTGGSGNRGELVRRFNEDPACRVFVGSLMAGGAGIDLTAASVLIHYDRWWNAAREDQATDRIHRIGQKRAVQIIKMVTTGTIEERIDSIIARKRKLAAETLHCDHPKTIKSFSREELIEILEERGEHGQPADVTE